MPVREPRLKIGNKEERGAASDGLEFDREKK
jgi:hypothetical protein